MENEYKNRIKNIKDNLYSGGGYHQGHFLLTAMMSGLSKAPDIDPIGVLDDIAQLLKEYRSIIVSGGIVPVKSFVTGTEGDAYACLDNDLKFCVKHYGEKDWKDILYVFPYMNCNTAYDVSFKYDSINTPDI